MVAFRMDPRLRGRVDAVDVVQDAFVEASAHRAEYFRSLGAGGTPLFLWLRGVVSNKLLEVHRHHLGTRMRDAKREVGLDGGGGDGAGRKWDETAGALYGQLTAGLTGASVAAVRGEMKVRLAEALDAMDPTDREVLALRHF